MTRRRLPCSEHPLSPNTNESPPSILLSTHSSPEIPTYWGQQFRQKCIHQPIRRNSEDSMYIQAILHKVQKNDTLAGIGLFYGIALQKLKKANRLWTNDSIHSRRELYIPLKDCQAFKDYTIDKDTNTITFHKTVPQCSAPANQGTRPTSPNETAWLGINKELRRPSFDEQLQNISSNTYNRSRLSFGSSYPDLNHCQETASDSSYSSSSDSSWYAKTVQSNDTIQSPTFPPTFIEYTAELVTVKASTLSFFAPSQHPQTSSCPPTPPINPSLSTSPPTSTYRSQNRYAKGLMEGIRSSLDSIRPTSPRPDPNEHKLTVFYSSNGSARTTAQ
ncbi:hypothetical protein NQZ79_g115 [Umbelopsis isabellina]|nr:hypothetical protein NQZ79_g115 [Umbelopsis isabellina]